MGFYSFCSLYITKNSFYLLEVTSSSLLLGKNQQWLIQKLILTNILDLIGYTKVKASSKNSIPDTEDDRVLLFGTLIKIKIAKSASIILMFFY